MFTTFFLLMTALAILSLFGSAHASKTVLELLPKHAVCVNSWTGWPEHRVKKGKRPQGRPR